MLDLSYQYQICDFWFSEVQRRKLCNFESKIQTSILNMFYVSLLLELININNNNTINSIAGRYILCH